MGLIDLKTNLRSLKYGNDRPGGGSSGQPYIVTPIPEGYVGSKPDFLLRQGALDTTPITVGGVTLPVPTDSVRITKFLDSIEGQLFIVKQNALERQNPSIPGGLTRIYNPANTVVQVGSLPLGFHLNKQGAVGSTPSYAQGGTDGYFVYTLNKNLQEDVSRLSVLFDTKITSTSNIIGRRSSLLREFDISRESEYSLSYNGGPDSIGGIGRTRIKLAGAVDDPRNRTNTYKLVDGSIQNPNRIYSFTNNLLSQQESKGKTKSTYLSGITDYRVNVNKSLGKYTIPETPYTEFNREKTYGTSGTVYSIFPQKLIDPNTSVSVDSLNATLPTTLDVAQDPSNNLFNKDLAKFFFEVIDPNPDSNNIFLFFRAYITSIGDNFKGEWQPYKYVGRAENFYRYTGFSRDVSLSFTIYAHSRDEMIPLYRKLNNLLGVISPRYLGTGYMAGNFVKLTVGDYFNSMPGIINSINLKPSFEAGWDINRYNDDGEPIPSTDTEFYVGQIPRMIEIDMTFTPIHDFTPEYGETFIRNTPVPKQEKPEETPAGGNEGTNAPASTTTVGGFTSQVGGNLQLSPIPGQINTLDDSAFAIESNSPYFKKPVTAVESQTPFELSLNNFRNLDTAPSEAPIVTGDISLQPGATLIGG